MKDLMLPGNLKLYEAEVASLDDRIKKAFGGKEPSIAERRKLLLEAQVSEATKRDYASARVDRVRLNILDQCELLEAFEYIPLAKDQQPVLYTEQDQSYSVKVIAQMGGIAQDQWANADAVNNYQPYIYNTDLIFYPLMSPVSGDLNVSDRQNARLAHEMKVKIDTDLWTLWDAIFGIFPTGTYVLDSRVSSAGVIPTSNLLDESSEGAITLAVMKNVLKLLLRLGRTIRTIYVSPLDLPDTWDWVSVVSGYTGSGFIEDPKQTVDPTTRREIITNGPVNNLFGYRINWKPLNTLATGKFYVATDQPAGKFYHKPDYDRVDFFSRKECRTMGKDNMEGLDMSQTAFMLIPAPYRMNSIRVDLV